MCHLGILVVGDKNDMNSEQEVMALEQANAEGDVEGELTAALMTDPKIILAFMFAGDATITIRGKEKRYTYRISRGDLRQEDVARGYTQPPYWVKYLSGRDNENDYLPLGMIQFGLGGKSPMFKVTKNVKSAKRSLAGFPLPMAEQAPHIKGFNMVFEALLRNQLISGFEIWHEGRCSRCNRKLTDDASIQRGFGPTCFEMVGGEAGIQQFYVDMFPVAALFSVTGSTPVAQTPVKAFGSGSYTGSAAAMAHYAPTSTGESIANVRQRIVPKPKPSTPKAIVAAVNEDAEIAKMAADLWAKNPANPVNVAPKVAAEPLPVNQFAAAALARSQNNWTLDDAVEALKKRRIVNLNLTSTKVADKTAALVGGDDSITRERNEEFTNDWTLSVSEGFGEEPLSPLPSLLTVAAGRDTEITTKVNAVKAESIEKYTMDGIMTEKEAFNFWYRRFATNLNIPVEG
jgi:hypothetical protein